MATPKGVDALLQPTAILFLCPKFNIYMKDPAFLFYSSDFLIGTSLLSNEDCGKYIKILCWLHQHGPVKKEVIENLVGNLSDNLMVKFRLLENGDLVNDRLFDEVEKRKKFTESRRNNGKNGGRKPKINLVDNLKDTHKHNLAENENENKNKEENINNILGEKFFNQNLLVPEMKKCFIENFPDAFIDENDLPALLEIAKKIFKWLSLHGNFLDHKEQILENFETIITHCKADSFLQKYSISQINKNFSSVIQSLKSNGTNSKNITKSLSGNYQPTGTGGY